MTTYHPPCHRNTANGHLSTNWNYFYPDCSYRYQPAPANLHLNNYTLCTIYFFCSKEAKQTDSCECVTISSPTLEDLPGFLGKQARRGPGQTFLLHRVLRCRCEEGQALDFDTANASDNSN
ncbi:hypothetical protein PtA15_12A205 [Puccinia triticina]|uniref:Uncharacterized protein n=1 Tax=Puccinia triticina TaxID=208348 RepID=A0ABY7CY38_9BASI|nr:uncharacterized protein PtA15_12A205 [Puccinia triticina]WAQ90218.1 hypothetical protein PtA15_12A205 [Puccinia triticina]